MNTKTLVTIIVVVILVIAGVAWYQKSSMSSSETDMTNSATSTDQTTPSDMNENSSQATSTDSTATTSTSTVSAGVNAGASAMVNAGAVKEFTISGKDFSMTPSTLTVNKGDKVRITFKNVSGTHDLIVDGYNAKTPVLATGQSATVEFTADKAGSFEYYCGVGNHRAMGMKGTLTVK